MFISDFHARIVRLKKGLPVTFFRSLAINVSCCYFFLKINLKAGNPQF